MNMKRCYLVRHAQTTWNRDNRIQGHSDLPLSPLGQQQAARVAAWFATRHLSGIFSSGLQRAIQTAQHIASGNGHGASPIIQPALAEMHLGAWEGLTPDEVDAQFGGAYQQWKRQPSSVQIPDAEPLTAFRVRVAEALEQVVASMPEGEFVIVSHGGVIAAVLADLLDADYDALLRRLRLDNGGITAMEFGTGLPHVLWINSTIHLDGLSCVPGNTWL